MHPFILLLEGKQYHKQVKPAGASKADANKCNVSVLKWIDNRLQDISTLNFWALRDVDQKRKTPTTVQITPQPKSQPIKNTVSCYENIIIKSH